MTAILGEQLPAAESWRRRKAHESMLFATTERILRNPVGLFAVVGLMLILIFGATGLDWLPVLGLMDKDWESFSALHKVLDVGLHCVLPVVTLTYGSLAYLSRQMRAGMLDVLQQDYIRTARAKGLGEWAVVVRHGLRNGLMPVVTLIGFEVSALFGGLIVTEAVFSVPGLGQYVVTAIMNRDYPAAQGIVLILAGIVVLGNLTVDLLYGWLDPRTRVRAAA